MAFTSKSVQFRIPEDVVTAYKARAVAPWAIFCDKQFLHKYEGKDLAAGARELEQYLELLVRNESAAVYMLAVYEDLKANQKIKPSTEYDGSFNFRFKDTVSQFIGGGGGGDASYRLLNEISKMRTESEAMKQQIADLTAPDEDEPEEKSQAAKMGEMLMDSLKPILPDLAKRLGNGVADMLFGGQGAAKPAAFSGMAHNEQQQLLTAVEVMKERTADIVPLLCKFAELSKTNPIVYGLAIAKIREL